jgi:hypothetical protein
VTVITGVDKVKGKLVVRGTASDNGPIKKVLVNGREAQATAPNFAEWEVVFEDSGAEEVQLIAHAEDAAGNVEKVPHAVRAR